MTEFVHLHNHTDYSLLDGAMKIGDMVSKAKSLGMKSIAITDHGNMFGALNFYEKCKENEIKPIVGCEFYMAEGSRKIKSGTEFGNKYYHLILLAKDNTGYRNLMKLNSTAYIDGYYYKPRIDFEVLEQYHEGLVCSSACIAGVVPKLIINDKLDEAAAMAMRFNDIFGKGNYFLELQDHGIPEEKKSNKGLIEISRKTGIPLIATNDIHYLNREHASAQEILICIGTQKTINDPDRMTFYNDEFYMKSPDEMAALFPYAPEAISNTKLVEEMCNLEIDFPGPKFPIFEIPSEFPTQGDYLRHLTYEGLKKRYKEITPEIKERVEYELNTIIDLKFPGYFLIVADFINWAKDHGIPVGPGRGSGAGSIVAYCMKITDIDPLKYDLLFERFLNKDRVSLPDFDVDFANEGRQQVIDYVTRKYGAEKVGQIITFGTLKAKAVLKDVARVLEIPFAEANDIVRPIPNQTHKKATLASMLGEVDKFKEDPELSKKVELVGIPELIAIKEKGGIYEKLFRECKYLENMARHASLHAAGIVIGEKELSEYVPLFKGTKEDKANSVATQYTMDKIENCGLVKMDFLGLKTLDVIKHCQELIRKKEKDFDASAIPMDDKKTYTMLSAGKSTAVFQFESIGMQKVLKDAKPTSIEDLIALNALFRPGPIQYIPQFCNCKHGKEPIHYPHPNLEPLLKNTYGVIVYQEQVMKVAQIVGGFSLGEADILRRNMSKKKEDKLKAQKAKFMEGAKSRGYSVEVAENIFAILEKFAGYGFNKSHAAAYSVVAYRTAYLKCHYPAEFMAANLTNEIGNPDHFKMYLDETKAMKLKVLPPTINVSEKFFTVNKGNIVYGIQGIKDTGDAVVDEVVRVRNEGGPFKSFDDFLKRVDLRVLNKRVVDSLIKAGVFDELEPNRAKLAYNAERLIDFYSAEQEKEKMGMISLFGDDDVAMQPMAMEEVPDWDMKEKLAFEKDRLGFYVSGHPLDKYKRIYQKYVTLPMNDLANANPDRNYVIIGLVKNIKNFLTKKNKSMGVVTIETFDGDLDIVFFEKQWKDYLPLLAEDKTMAFFGQVDKRNPDSPQLRGNEVKEIDDLAKSQTGHSQVHIVLQEPFTEAQLENLREFMLDHEGGCSVFLHIKGTGKETVVHANHQIKVKSDFNVPEESELWQFITDIWKE
ncbi:MAG: DNA polymerase III subunit alpha [Spirochaetia bacterium]|nr:DNA polymerase III subunit alpha [Spirochaetia bacterium]